jgi:acyl-CoA synthetase (AMP-forming)/AMP-acid ligase II
MLDAAGSRRLDTVQSLMLGSTSVPASAIEAAEAAGMKAFRCYGSTEHPTITTGLPEQPLDRRASTDGTLMPYCEVRLVDAEGREVPPGQPGEILSRGPDLMAGYLDPKHNEEAFTEDGWFRTGDIAVMTADGYVTIVDRKKDILIRAGENFASKEIEDILLLHPGVAEAAVIGWPDARYGERIAAFVKFQPGAQLDAATLQAHFVGLGHSRRKAPEIVLEIAEMPRTPTGKVRKPDLRRRVAELAREQDAASPPGRN